MAELDWMDRAACAGTHDPAFVADHEDDAAPAVAVCARCPVQPECLAYGTSTRQWGTWGGQLLANGVPIETRRARRRRAS